MLAVEPRPDYATDADSFIARWARSLVIHLTGRADAADLYDAERMLDAMLASATASVLRHEYERTRT